MQASVGDVGLPITLTMAADTPSLVGATIVIEVARPSGLENVEWAASSSTTDGVTTVNFTTVSGDLPVLGIYWLRIRVTFPDGRVLRDPTLRALEVR